MGDLAVNLAVSAAAIVVLIGAIMAAAIAVKNQSSIDIFWGPGFVLVAVVSCLCSMGPDPHLAPGPVRHVSIREARNRLRRALTRAITGRNLNLADPRVGHDEEEVRMDDQALNRRRILLGAGAAGAVAIGAVAGAPSASASHSSPAGSWKTTRKDDPPGDPMRVSLILSFAEGGVVISHDLSPAGPPQTGTWARRADGGFKATFWSGQPGPDGPGAPGFTIRVRIRGSVHMDRISGTYEYWVFDASGAVDSTGTGSFSGRRVDA